MFGCVGSWIGVLVTQSMATAFPPGVATLRDVVEAVMPRNHVAGEASNERLAIDEVFVIVRQILAEQTGIPEEKIDPDNRFMQDLGLD